MVAVEALLVHYYLSKSWASSFTAANSMRGSPTQHAIATPNAAREGVKPEIGIPVARMVRPLARVCVGVVHGPSDGART